MASVLDKLYNQEDEKMKKIVILLSAVLIAVSYSQSEPPYAYDQTNNSVVVSDFRYPIYLLYRGLVTSFTLISGPSKGILEYNSNGTYLPINTNVAINTGNWYYSTDMTTPTTDSFTWICTYGTETSRVATYTINMETNTSPVANNQSISITDDNVYSPLNLSYTDKDYYQLRTFFMRLAPTNGTLYRYDGTNYIPITTNDNVTSSTWYYTPNKVGNDRFQWCVSDRVATSSVATFSLTITTNTAPIACTWNTTTVKNTPITFPAVYIDPNSNQTFTISIVDNPLHGSVSKSGSYFTYSPANNYEGIDYFTWKVNDGVVDSNIATNYVLVREQNSRAGMMVLLIVPNALLPEITNEVARLKADLENEGYTAKITSSSINVASNLWNYLRTEFMTPMQFVSGAILIGHFPLANNLSSGEPTDCAYWNMVQFQKVYPMHIWVSRITAISEWGYPIPPGEAKLIKRYLDVNHDYRTGTHRLPYMVHWAMNLYPESTPFYYPGDATNALIVWPERTNAGNALNAAWRAGGELMDETSHGDRAAYNYYSYIVTKTTIHCMGAKIRFGCMTSCSSGAYGGIVNYQIHTRGGGNIFSVGASQTTYTGAFTMLQNADINFLNRLAGGDSWGNSIIRGYPFDDRYRAIFYGDLSVSPKMSPPNQIPVISTVTVDRVTGTVPININFSVTASDPDGVVSNYEWFVRSFALGQVEPELSGSGLSSISYTYTLPYRYMVRVEVIDEYKARAWEEREIALAPEPGTIVRVNCGGGNYTGFSFGSTYTDSVGNVWLHDQEYASGSWGYMSNSSGVSNSAAVSGTSDPVLYKLYRYCPDNRYPPLTYRVPVSNGWYIVKLGFADMISSGAGQRIMDISAEGIPWFTGLDPAGIAGLKTAYTVTMYVEVKDGLLDFVLSKNISSPQYPYLNCFEIIPYAGNHPPIASNLNVTTSSGVPVAFRLSATDPDNDNITSYIITPPTNGVLSGTAPDLVYTPNPGYAGVDTFTFRASDASLTGNIGIVSITVHGLISHWTLDEGSGTTAIDIGPATNNGALINGVTWGTGLFTNALWFDGVSSGYVTVATAPYYKVTNNFTITLWANPQGARNLTKQSTGGTAGTSGQRYAIYPTQGNSAYGSGHAGAGVSVGTNGISVFEHADGYLPSPLVLSNAEVSAWTHIAVVYQDRKPYLYTNGVLAKAGLTSPKIVHPGCSMGGGSYGWYMGGLDDVRIHNYPLLPSQVASLAAEGVLVPPVFGSVTSVTGIVGQSFIYTILVGGTKPISLNVTGLPSGLIFDGTNSITGTPVTSGTNSVLITADNVAGSNSMTLTLIINFADFDNDGIPDETDTDDDNDGMPDDWEITNGFNPYNPSDASVDADGDGMDNLAEHIAGTDPHNSNSVLKITSISFTNTDSYVRFLTQIGKLYSIQYKDDLLNTNPWAVLTNITATTTNIEVKDLVDGIRQRFYRIRVNP